MVKIEDRTVLESMSYKEIRAMIQKKLTKEDNTNLSAIRNEDDRKKFLIELYYKYIDQIIAEKAASDAGVSQDGTTTTSETGEMTTVEEVKPVEPPKESKPELEVGTETKMDKLKIDPETCVSVTIRNVPSVVNGKVSISISRLLLLLVRNKFAKVYFGKKERAKQFIEIVKDAKSVKGVYGMTAEIRERIIKSIAETNKIDLKK